MLKNLRIGLALTGSFCTFQKIISVLDVLLEYEAEVFPIMSFNASSIDTRFGKAEEFIKILEEKTGKKVIRTIETAEPIGPKKMFDILVVAPATGNTIAKLANGITDTPVTMAVKSHLRNASPVVIGVSSNDALSGGGENIARLLNRKNYYFVPMKQDDSENKPFSLVADMNKIPETIIKALSSKQIQPIFF